MTEPLVIIGAGGHGREVLDIVEAMNAVTPTYDFLGFLDDGINDCDELERRKARILGSAADTARLGAVYLIGIGDGRVRATLDQQLATLGCVAARAVHPAATIGADVDFGDGLVIAAGARITTNVRAGRHLHVNLNATIAHDCRLGDYVTILPGVNVSGNVALADGATLGTGAAVLPGVEVGKCAFIGAGAVVLSNVGAHLTVAGVPARPIARG